MIISELKTITRAGTAVRRAGFALLAAGLGLALTGGAAPAGAQSGACCSSQGGIGWCEPDGTLVCNDRRASSECGCTISTQRLAPPPPAAPPAPVSAPAPEPEPAPAPATEAA
ncbi:MAG: hypothetical protein HXY25_03015, partial [Alphaproteobacteria bacterium]|nr:hypothetical protein [Alphaproteobacteria bacterium]